MQSKIDMFIKHRYFLAQFWWIISRHSGSDIHCSDIFQVQAKKCLWNVAIMVIDLVMCKMKHDGILHCDEIYILKSILAGQ